eukprot:11475918-Ditylum_brightwellii.AAC.1
MTSGGKKVKCQNAVQNHQSGELLPILDPEIDGYEPVKLYQWEICVQFYAQGAFSTIPMVEI